MTSPQNANSTPEKGIKELLDEQHISHIPDLYVLPPHARPCASPVCCNKQPPVIDLSDNNRSQNVQTIDRACQDWGIFQVINHGVPRACTDSVWSAAEEFFQLPAKERMRWYSHDGSAEVVYKTTQGSSWADALTFQLSGDQNCSFSQAPEFFRGPIVEYLKEMRKLALIVCEALAKSLGIDSERLIQSGATNVLYMKLHYYSPCPDPSLVLGKMDHTDPNLFTILMQDQVRGLQVLKDGSWVEIKPLQGAFLVNVGDQLQILTNGKWTSCEHRVVTNKDRARTSVACFLAPAPLGLVGPLAEMITESNPKLYRELEYREYLQIFSKDSTKKYALKQCQISSVTPG